MQKRECGLVMPHVNQTRKEDRSLCSSVRMCTYNNSNDNNNKKPQVEARVAVKLCVELNAVTHQVTDAPT